MLYKYRAWNDNTKRLLETEKVWFARPDALNDPYDCQIRVRRDDITPEFVVALIARQATASKAERSDYFKKAFQDWGEASSHIEDHIDYLKDRIGEFQDLFHGKGIFSLSRNPVGMLMWSHYAEDHRGICIGFDEEADGVLRDRRFTNPVVYTDAYPEVFAGDVVSADSWEDLDALANLIIHTKANCWAYEEEVRVVIEDGGKEMKSPGPIAEVIFGAKCSRDTVGEVKERCGSSVRYGHIEVAEASFELALRMEC